MKTGKSGLLRPRMLELIDAAARQGYPDAGGLWRMTLREARWALESFAAARRAENERDERLAWMSGYYFALALHAPRRYPRRSGETFRPAGGAMSEAQMKEALLAFAANRAAMEKEDEHDIGDAEN